MVQWCRLYCIFRVIRCEMKYSTLVQNGVEGVNFSGFIRMLLIEELTEVKR